MAKSEYAGGIDFTSFIDKDGFQHSLTSRGETSGEAYADLQATIALAIQEGGKPFVNAYNRAEVQGELQTSTDAPVSVSPATVVETAQALGGVAVTDEGIAKATAGIDGYLGMKAEKLENIAEGQFYDVVAQQYSYDGTWVNFFGASSNLSLAGHYYNTKVGAKIFNELFHWAPALVEKAPIPGGAVILTVIGTKGKKTNDIYQNIKSVVLA